jgi:hypothetical protein
MLAHACIPPSTWEAEAGVSPGRGLPRLHRPCLKKAKKRKEKRRNGESTLVSVDSTQGHIKDI